MNFLSLAVVGAVAVLSLTDPTSDALGDGTLTPPTSPIYAHSAIFDLQELTLETVMRPSGGGDVANVAGSRLTLSMGAVDPDDTAPAGFSGVVIDVYLDTGPGGSDTTLVGPGMLLPADGGWDYALRLSPAGAFGIAYQEPADTAETVAASPPTLAPAAEPEQDEAAPLPDELDGAGLNLAPLLLSIEGNRFVVELPLAVDEDTVVYAVTGVYDPFSSTGWRALASSVSPWAYSGGDQLAPVIDVLAVDQSTQARALQTGVLPRPLRSGSSGLPWLLLMGLGVLVALAGLWFRRKVAPPERTGLPYGLPPEPEPEPAAEVEVVAVEAPEASAADDEREAVVEAEVPAVEAEEEATDMAATVPHDPAEDTAAEPTAEIPAAETTETAKEPDAFELFGSQTDADDEADEDDFAGSVKPASSED